MVSQITLAAANFTSQEIESVNTYRGEDMIPNSVQRFIDIILTNTILPIVAGFGVITNILNITVFLKCGVKDCVSICLLSLAISDLGVSGFGFSLGILQAIVASQWYFYVDPMSIFVLQGWALAWFCDVTMYHTAFLSLERCMCVLFPFHFKNLITPQRAVGVLIGIYVLSLASYIPHYISCGLSEVFDPFYNKTRVMIWFTDDRYFIEYLINLYLYMGMNFLSLAAVILCTVGMIFGLRRSSKFSEANSKKDSVTSRKSRIVVKMVTILSLVYIVCTSTRSAAVIPRFVVAGIAPFQQHHNVHLTVAAVYILCGVLNSSVNIFVYYLYKPKFKDVLLNVLGCPLPPE